MPRFFLRLVSLGALLGLTLAAGAQASAAPQLLRNPTLSRTQIAFAFGGDIWIVGREGGDAHRLVTGYNLLSGPFFSPDGSLVAFSGNYEGHDDVFVVPAGGGEPRRLTYSPDANVAAGWTRDGKEVLFTSSRTSTNDPHHIFKVSLAGDFPSQLPLAMAEGGSYSPDSTHLAYVPGFRWEPFWQGYRGGQTTSIQISDLHDSSTIVVPRNNSNDDSPMWIGNTIYFLSDRNGPVTLFAYDTQTKQVTRLLPSEGFDITSASAGPDAIVYAQFDSLHIYDLATRAAHVVHVTATGDMPQVRPHWVKVANAIENANISPTGARALFEAHGQIFSVPAEHGDVRNISSSPNTANRDPAWSPDGRWIAYFSDKSGEYELYLRDQKGLEAPRAIRLGTPSYFYSPVWSPDSKKVAYIDKHSHLWYVDIEHPTPVRVASALSGGLGPTDFDPAWSPDSKWITYTNVGDNFLHTVFAYSLDESRSRQVTDGLTDARFPKFDASGKYLYFAGSNNSGVTSQGLDMTSDAHPVTSAIYAAVLRRDVASPNELQSDDETVKPETAAPPAAAPGAPVPQKSAAPKPAFRIDFDGLLQRVVTLPIPEANYVELSAGKAGELFLSDAPVVAVGPNANVLQIHKYDVATRKFTPFAANVLGFLLSANGEKALLVQGAHSAIVPTTAPPQPGAGALDLSGMEVFVDPPAEWRQMYHETWRIERDFFYDPNYHGLNIAAAERRFEPYLAGIASRDDLTFLFEEMLSYLSVGHMFVRGGAQPAVPRINVGLLGADYRIENGRYRIEKIYDGENWNPRLQAPLTQPGSDVKTGDYLLAVNGRKLTASDNIYLFFQETAGKQTIISVGPSADGTGARDVTVVPVASEFGLRNYNWIESNRRKVDQLSGGKLAYVYLPDTGAGGFNNFNRYFFAQVGKQGVILDERFNHGGQIADYVIDYLNRKPMSILVPRDGKPLIDPPLAIYGPKVMIINEFAGSGGDALPWYFRKSNLGPLVGRRTWGGLVGIGGYPPLIDGGTVNAPSLAIGGLHGQWEVEGHGIAPDIDVWQDPRLIREGHDPQLEAAVRKALELLREHPVPAFKVPPYPDHHPVLPPG
jgi:tricorn protease